MKRVLVCSAILSALPFSILAAWPTDPTVNVPICTAAGFQESPQLVSDGAGGAIIAWEDIRNGNSDIYAHHLLATGATDTSGSWTTDGVAICTATGTQENQQLVSDGAGGAIITWGDIRTPVPNGYDIYAQYLDHAGFLPVEFLGLSVE